MNRWLAEFMKAQERLPCWFSRLVRPRLVFLPRWWPVSFGAWAYLHMVFIGPGLLDAPDDVRRYIVGHEYGHIYSKHTLLHLAYWLGVLGFVLGSTAHMPALGASACLVLAVVSLLAILPPLMRKREYQADDVAAYLYGKNAVLNGSLWTAKKTGTISDELRQSRLRRLGWKS